MYRYLIELGIWNNLLCSKNMFWNLRNDLEENHSPYKHLIIFSNLVTTYHEKKLENQFLSILFTKSSSYRIDTSFSYLNNSLSLFKVVQNIFRICHINSTLSLIYTHTINTTDVEHFMYIITCILVNVPRKYNL